MRGVRVNVLDVTVRTPLVAVLDPVLIVLSCSYMPMLSTVVEDRSSRHVVV
jgi:hypothetical protein